MAVCMVLDSTDGDLARLRAIWSRTLPGAVVNDTSDFFEIGGDSLAAFEVCMAIEDAYRISLPITTLIDRPTPVALMAEITAKRLAAGEGETSADAERGEREPGSGCGPLFELMRRGDDRPPLVLLAPGGGHLMGYAALVRALDANQTVVGFRLPGADGREEPLHSIEAQVERILPGIRNLDDRPLRLMGLSTGGLLAIELAHQLAAHGHQPALVGLADTIYPGFQDYGQTPLRTRLNTLKHEHGSPRAASYLTQRVKLRAETLTSAARAEVFRRTGRGFSPKAHEQYLYSLAGEMARRYVPPTYEGPSVLFAASETDPARTAEPWSTMLVNLDVEVFEGEHDAIVEDAENVVPLAVSLQRRLDNLL